MLNILVILTGGTIGSSLSGDYISVNSDDKKYKIIELFNQKFPDKSSEIFFDTLEPYTILSENLSGKYLNKLISCINESVIQNKYDGIIITHGTDTLQYSAAALGLAFAHTPIPIILVSSNYILDDERANGLNNFSLAVKYISAKNKTGVFVAYNDNLLNPLTLLPHMAYSDNLYSLPENFNVSIQTFKNSNYSFDLTDNFNKISLKDTAPILYIKSMPGQTYPSLAATNTKAILIETYHSGTLCTESELFKNFCNEAFSKNIPVYIIGVENRIAYESTKLYDELHLTVLPQISPVAAYVYLWFVLSMDI